jgi:hypothetical protein
VHAIPFFVQTIATSLCIDQTSVSSQNIVQIIENIGALIQLPKESISADMFSLMKGTFLDKIPFHLYSLLQIIPASPQHLLF